MKIFIYSIWKELLFQHESEQNTVKKTIEYAVKNKVSLQYAQLKNANLAQANLIGADLRQADLRGADLFYAQCHGAVFDHSNLSHANLLGADLVNASFICADLQAASMGSEIGGINLKGANLRGANLQTSKLIQFVGFGPFEGCLTYDHENNFVLNEGDGFYGSLRDFHLWVQKQYGHDSKHLKEYESIVQLIQQCYPIK